MRADVATLHANFGPATWLMDLNVDGVVNVGDVDTLIDRIGAHEPRRFQFGSKDGWGGPACVATRRERRSGDDSTTATRILTALSTGMI